MFTDRAIRNCRPSFWNSLNKNVKQCVTTGHFKTKLKTSLIDKYKWILHVFYIQGHVLSSFVCLLCTWLIYIISFPICKFKISLTMTSLCITNLLIDTHQAFGYVTQTTWIYNKFINDYGGIIMVLTARGTLSGWVLHTGPIIS